MKKLFLIVAVCCMMCTVLPSRAQSGAVVTEGTQTMKTYGFSDPNPIPNTSARFYPYFRFDGFSIEGEDREWKTVELENDYIKVTIFPEIGGKVWGAVDKTTGREFIYYNHVVKFRDIGMTGPWTSGGLEFNFGILGHAPTSCTPVDYITREKEDGSVSCYVASYDWITHTYWSVEISLPADAGYFTTSTTWYNQSGMEQPYYQWINGAFKASGNARFYYPGNHYIGHKGDLHDYPVDAEGRDISWYSQNAYGIDKSEHVIGHYMDFYGIYWHDDDFGAVHHAPYDEKLGMKIFLWSQSRAGAVWEDLLTDTDGQYVELQSGRMFNQPYTVSAYSTFKHFSFDPGLTDCYTDYWYPVESIGGISEAGPVGALFAEREGDDLKIAFSPVRDFSAEVRVYDGDREVKSLQMDAKTLQPWAVTLEGLGAIPEGRLRVVIGEDALVFSEDPEDNELSRPQEMPADFDWKSPYGLYTEATQMFNQKILAGTDEILKKALEKEPYFAPALNRLGAVCLSMGKAEEALEALRTSLSLNAYDSEANYLYGLCNFKYGRAVDAKDGFSIASRSAQYRSPAYTGLAEIYLREKNWAKAEHYAMLSLNVNKMDLKAQQVLMVVCRKTGRTDEAASRIGQVLGALPLYHFARFEKLYNSDGSWKDEFKSLVRNEFADETYMETALWYEAEGFTDEALGLLECAGDNPIALYERAYILNSLGREAESAELLDRANSISPEGVFPFRFENFKALKWAEEVSGDWKTRYYQALVLGGNQRYEEAVEVLKGVGDHGSAICYLTLAALKRNELVPIDRTYLDDLKKAAAVDDSWRTGSALLSGFSDEGLWDELVSAGEVFHEKYPDNYYITLKLARGYYEKGDYSAVMRIFDDMVLLPNEGATAAQRVYHASNVCVAMDLLQKKNYSEAQTYIDRALEWPENLGSGKPYDDLIDRRMEDYLQSRLLSALGDADRAGAALENVTVRREGSLSDVISAFALRELGRTAEADEIVSGIERSSGNDPYAKWCVSAYRGEDIVPAAEFLAGVDHSHYRAVDLGLVVKFIDFIR